MDERYQPQGRRAAFTLVECIVILVILGILFAIAIPSFVRAREQARATICVANLKQIRGAQQEWAMDERAGATASCPAVSELVGPYLRAPVSCPSDGTYAVTTVDEPPTCTIGANTTEPKWSHVLP